MAQQGSPAPPTTTIVPFNDISKLPACAVNCGPLYDANGACVPPAVPVGDVAGYLQCFCLNQKVAPFASGPDQVCPSACPGDPNGLKSIANWYSKVCSVTAPPKTTNPTATNKPGVTGNPTPLPETGGGDWLSTHYKWVIMIVIVVVGIAGIWIGACIWRRRYLKKKDRQSTLGQKQSGSKSHPSWGPPPSGVAQQPMDFTREPLPAVYAADEKQARKSNKQKKKWTVGDRT